MKYELKRRPRDPASQLAKRRSEILDEYHFHQLAPVRIAREPISLELALHLGLIVDSREEPAE